MTTDNPLQEQMNSLQSVLEQFINETRIATLRLTEQQEQRWQKEEQRRKEEEQRRKEEEQRRKEEEQRRKEEEQRRKEEEQAERRRETRAWNKKWGEIANKLGTVVEDIVAPNIPRVARDYFGCQGEPEDFSVRRTIRNIPRQGMNKEFDTIAVYPDTVLFNETKELVRQLYLEQFADFIEQGLFFEYFPQYRDRRFIPIFSSLYLSEEAVNYLSKRNIYALAMGEETMDLLNFNRVSLPQLPSIKS